MTPPSPPLTSRAQEVGIRDPSKSTRPLAAIQYSSPSRGGACPPNTPRSSQLEESESSRKVDTDFGVHESPEYRNISEVYPTNRSRPRFRRQPLYQRHDLQHLLTAFVSPTTIPQRVSSKSFSPSRRSSLSYGGDLTSDAPFAASTSEVQSGDAPVAHIKSSVPGRLFSHTASQSHHHPTTKHFSTGIRRPFRRWISLSADSSVHDEHNPVRSHSRSTHQSSNSVNDITQASSDEQRIVGEHDKNAASGRAQSAHALQTSDADLQLCADSQRPSRDISNPEQDETLCQPVLTTSSSNYGERGRQQASLTTRQSEISDILSLYLALSKSPSLRSLLAPPPRHNSPLETPLSTNSSPFYGLDPLKVAAILQSLGQRSLPQDDTSSQDQNSGIGSEPEIRSNRSSSMRDSSDSHTETDQLVGPSNDNSRQNSILSSTSTARQWLQEWLNKRISGVSRADPETNLTSRPMYRRARQQASSEDYPRSESFKVGSTDGPASRSTEKSSVIHDRRIAPNSDPEAIERVIKGLEDVLQRAVSIAQQASTESNPKPNDPSPRVFSPITSHTAGQTYDSATSRDAFVDSAGNRKRSSDYSDIINEYHRTLTWLSNKSDAKPTVSRTTSKRTSTKTKESAVLGQDQIENEKEGGFDFGSRISRRPRPDKAPAQHPAKGRDSPSPFTPGTPQRQEEPRSQLPSRDTDTSISPFTPRDGDKKIRAEVSGKYPVYTPNAPVYDAPSTPTISRDFAFPTNSISFSLPARQDKPATKPVMIDVHKPADQRVRYSEQSFGPPSRNTSRSEPHKTNTPGKNVPVELQPQTRQIRTPSGKPGPPKIRPRRSSHKFRPFNPHKRKSASELLKQPTTQDDLSRQKSDRELFVIHSGKEDDWDDGEANMESGIEQPHPNGTDLQTLNGTSQRAPWLPVPLDDIEAHQTTPHDAVSTAKTPGEIKQDLKDFQRGLRRHHSFSGHGHLSLHRVHRRPVIARDWSTKKKRYTAIVACISTSLVGLVIGIYAGEVPAIQHAIADESTHYSILGNVFFYLGLAVTTAGAWPLPLLYGRRKFTVSAMCLLLTFQFPQALVVMQQRLSYISTYRAGLLLPRAASGLAMGFANGNFLATLLDLFGASLQSGNPHQEIVMEHDVRRHGGGMGVWLSIWTWCHVGSIGVGFFVGAVVAGFINVSWGFWIVIFATIAVLLLNIASPETRAPVYRNSVAEVTQGKTVSRRVGRGEIMMHLYSEGPLHWWEEVGAGTMLCLRMLSQSGFAILALYEAWIYAQVVMIMILLAALTSEYYLLRPQYVALCVASFPLGALLAVPFQKASLFSRSRYHAQRTDSNTFEKRVSWSSHLVRRAVFMVGLPLAVLAYTLVSSGPPTPLGLPVLFSGIIGFLTNLALCECYGLIMETFDTSDLQPGMTGRPRREISDETRRKQTNFSCFPRVSAGLAIVHTASFVIAAAATAVGSIVERRIGAKAATGVVAGVLAVLTLLLIGTLTRIRTVQIVPSGRADTIVLGGPGEDLPVVIGNPRGTTRRISLLELGAMTRWTEIRRRNRLLGEQA